MLRIPFYTLAVLFMLPSFLLFSQSQNVFIGPLMNDAFFIHDYQPGVQLGHEIKFESGFSLRSQIAYNSSIGTNPHHYLKESESTFILDESLLLHYQPKSSRHLLSGGAGMSLLFLSLNYPSFIILEEGRHTEIIRNQIQHWTLVLNLTARYTYRIDDQWAARIELVGRSGMFKRARILQRIEENGKLEESFRTQKDNFSLSVMICYYFP